MRNEKETLLKIFHALQFAAEKHKNQRRKGTDGSPYINHPIEVVLHLCTCCEELDTDVIAAAILHDTVEDTDTTLEEIRETFGEKIMRLVREVTDDKNLPKAARKKLQVETARGKSFGAKLIKIADKICNVMDVVKSPPENWSVERKREYLDWAERVVSGMAGTNERLEKLFKDRLRTAKEYYSVIPSSNEGR